MATRGFTLTTTLWCLLAWNALSVVWYAVGHPGVRGSGGEGRVLVVITAVVLWSIGNVLVGSACWLLDRRRRKSR